MGSAAHSVILLGLSDPYGLSSDQLNPHGSGFNPV